MRPPFPIRLFRLVRALEREAGSASATPIIALTAHAMEEDRDRCPIAGEAVEASQKKRPGNNLLMGAGSTRESSK
jgi:CheY-like chemotaxis protein